MLSGPPDRQTHRIVQRAVGPTNARIPMERQRHGDGLRGSSTRLDEMSNARHVALVKKGTMRPNRPKPFNPNFSM